MSIEERLESIERLLLAMNKRNAEKDKDKSQTDALSIEQVVKIYGLKKSFLYSLVHTKRIPHYKVGRLLFFNKKEIEAFILSNRVSTYDEAESFAAAYIAKKRLTN